LFYYFAYSISSMFSNLFGRKEADHSNSLFKDKVYINTVAKTNACIQLAREVPATVFIAWFAETANAFKQSFVQAGIIEPKVTEVKHLHAAQWQNHPVVFVEHYPLHTKEVALVNSWGKSSIIVYSAMDEPLFRHFGSDKMVPLIKLLGMKESESIEHAYVTQSIEKGQQKIADKVLTEQPAASQAAWMEINLK